MLYCALALCDLLFLQVSDFYRTFRKIRHEAPVMLVGIKGMFLVMRIWRGGGGGRDTKGQSSLSATPK